MIFGKKKENKKDVCTCACGGENQTEKRENTVCCCNSDEKICCIKVLGSGCKNCHTLFDNAKIAVENLGIDVEVGYVTDFSEIMKYGVMSMPALVVNEKVVSSGIVLKAEQIEKLLKDKIQQ